MKNCLRVLFTRTMTSLMILLVIGTNVFATNLQSARVHLPSNFQNLPGPQSVMQMPTEMLDPNPSAVRMRFTDPPLEMNTIELGGVNYESISLSGEGNIYDPGSPDVPSVSRMIMIDPTGNVDLRIANQHYTVQQLNNPLAPVQRLQGEDGKQTGEVDVPKVSIYTRDEWYPQNVVQITEPATLRDVRFVVVYVYPVQVNPVTGEVRIYDNIEVSVENSGGVGVNEITINPTSISPSFRKLYNAFENFEGSALDALPVFPGSYLIICRNDALVLAEAQRLADWRRRKGIVSSIATTVTTGGNTATAIRNYISAQYTASNGQLEFVTILGDVNNATVGVATEGTAQLDNYYGCISGQPNNGPNPDPVPDVAVGRVSGGTSGEIHAIVTKTLNYEQNPPIADPGWFTRGWCVAGTNFIQSNPSTKEYTRQIMLQHGLSTGPLTIWGGNVQETQMNDSLTHGLSVFNYRMSWIGEMSPANLNAAPINPELPLVMVITCNTGSFSSGGSLSEEWLAPSGQSDASPKGAIGAVGMWGSGTHVPFNNIVDAGMMYGLYVENIQEQGVALIEGKLQLYNNYQNFHSSEVQNFSYWSNLMGESATPIWRHYPDSLAVTKPANLNVGANNIALGVQRRFNSSNVENAFVCVYKDSVNYFRGYTNSLGQVNLNVPAATAGTYLKITITKDDIKPYLDSIQVVAGTTLAYQSLILDDDNVSGTVGNNDHIANPGETIDLPVKIRSVGGAVTGITGVLSSTAAGIQVTNANSAYPNIALAGDSALPTSNYRIHISNVFNGEPVVLYLDLTYSGGSSRIRLDITPVAGDVQYNSFSYSGPGGTPDPGEAGNMSITLRNSGSASLITATGILRSLDPLVTVNDSIGSYGNVPSSTNATNAVDVYNVSFNGGTFNGHQAPMLLIVQDNNGFRDSTQFYITVGTLTSTSPTGPDGYGYYAFDNTESQPAGSAATYNWIEIVPALGGSGTNLNFSDLIEDDDDQSNVNLPFAFTFYGHAFPANGPLTICSNGWLAFGDYEIDDFRNYRMGTPIGPPYQVAAYWDDLKTFTPNGNCYYWYDSVSHLFVVEWRAQTLWTSVSETFEIIIYDPAFYPSASGNGKIKVQYQTVNLNANSGSNDNDYASAGIQNADHSAGLDYYYWNTYSSAAQAPLAANRAIMYTTDASGALVNTLSLTAPNGGENWYLNQSYNITWTSTGILGNVDVQLNRNYPGGGWETLFAGTANDGFQLWNAAGAASANARVRVLSTLNPAVGDTSNANFSIVTPTIVLATPNGGELWVPGNDGSITWTATGLGAVDVQLNRSYPSASWETLASNYLFSFLDWPITGTPSSTCRIRVRGTTSPTIGDTSNANFTINTPPVIVHELHGDALPGAVYFRALVTDDAAGITTTLFYRLVGAGSYSQQNLPATGNPNEYGGNTPALTSGKYEYYIRALDAQGGQTLYPASGTLTFDVGDLCNTVISYDDGTSERSNWVDGPDFKWAVKFTPVSYPFKLCGAQIGVSATHPDATHVKVKVSVYLADGSGGLPGTVVYQDSTGTVGNVSGGLPNGNAWATVIIRSGGNPLTMTSEFYISVENIEPRVTPEAFSEDTAGVRNHRSYFYDDCLSQWFNEDAATPNARPGNRLIRARGFNSTPPTITIYPSGNDAVLNWTATGAAYYKIYSDVISDGAYTTLVGTTSSATFTDVGAFPANVKKFYRVVASDIP